jgi:hypothetical protein
MFGFKVKNEMLFLLISFVGLNLGLMIGGVFLKALVFFILMAQYNYLYMAQATMKTGETLTCSMNDVKEFGTKFSQKMKSDRKAAMKLLSDKVKEVAHKVRISAFNFEERLKIGTLYLHFIVWSCALLCSHWGIKIAALTCVSSLYMETFYPYLGTVSAKSENHPKLSEELSKESNHQNTIEAAEQKK